MAFFSKKEVVLGSPMDGFLTYKGEPASGAVITRKIRWKDKADFTDTTLTDEQGYFEFPVATDTWKPLLPTEFVAHQEIHAEYHGKEYLIWAMGKMDERLYGELGGKPKNLTCELTRELDRVEVDHGMLGTSCRWTSVEYQ